ncbi:SOS response-associated peptidase [Agrococcus sp. SCSIO52902]|uniref:SOS response-associated peptidase n=1 Tax=Agrococcus sp. SCSIO52902 TaxID=2933290 RepID=UPI001FF61888|nr:SOS response-associated peptidase [Agrococcus sp. SCSIO52902]UOW00661.1 SOS response-associated peptidase [Agrococcus sp. SCSIO52902]
MCGRYVLATPTPDLVALFEIDEAGADLLEPSWNIPPTTQVPIVVEPRPRDDAPPARRLESARWGLVPAWADDVSVGQRAFNARSETAASKPMFRDAVRERRALVPADGWYEWRRAGDEKTPFYINGDAPIAFAGLYAWWKQPDGTWLLSTSILTTASAGQLAGIHERMPLVVSPELRDAWLDPTEDGEAALEAVVAEAPDVVASLALHPVDRRVGSVREQGPDLIAPAPTE